MLASANPDGSPVGVIAQNNNVLHLYDAGSGVEIEPAIENVDAPITSFTYRPDGERLAIGISTREVREYDADTHEPVGRALESDLDSAFGVAYSPDGSLLAGTSLGMSATAVLDAVTGSPVGGLLIGGQVHDTYQTSLVQHLMVARPAFSPDGRQLVSPSFEGATVLWDPVTWRDAACDLANRDLTDEVWARQRPGRDRQRLCP